jgi:hypothetical protein
MGILDRFRDASLAREGITNGHYGGYPRLVEQLQPDERRELNELRARRDALINEERAAEQRLLRLRSELDEASIQLVEGARGATEKSVAQQVIACLTQLLPKFAKSSSWDNADLHGLANAFMRDRLAQLQPSRPTLASPPQRPEVEMVDPVKLGEAIVSAGRRAAAPDGVQRPFIRGPEQPRRAMTDDEKLAESIIASGRKHS